jgi:hypothetical protein
MSFITMAFGLGAQKTMVGYLTLDALISEDTALTGQVSRYPVQTGKGYITDNIMNESETLALVGSVTGGGVTLLSGGGRSKLISAKDALRRMRDERVPITILTGMEMYVDMGIENIRISRTGPLERIEVAIELRKMVFVTLRSAEVPPAKAAPKAKGKAGATDTKVGKNPGNEAPPIRRSQADILIFGKGK